MTRETLLELRKQINDSLLPLVLDGEGDPRERADLLIGMIQAGNEDESLYRKAFEVVNNIDDTQQKTDYLFRLLGEVETSLQTIDDSEPSSETTEAPVEYEEPHHDEY